MRCRAASCTSCLRRASERRRALRIVEVRYEVDELWFATCDERFELLDAHAIVVASHHLEIDLVAAEDLKGREVARVLHRDDIALIEQHLAHQIDALLRAGRDQQIVGAKAHASTLQTRGDPFRAAERTLRTRCTAAPIDRRSPARARAPRRSLRRGTARAPAAHQRTTGCRDGR